MKDIAVLFISNQLSDETTSRANILKDVCESLDNEEYNYHFYWVYDKDDEYWHITSECCNIPFFICTQKQLKSIYHKIFYNWNDNFNVILYTLYFQQFYNYDYIWSIEDDIICRNNKWEYLFKGFENNTSDLLGTHIGYFNDSFFDKEKHLDISFENVWDFNFYDVVEKYNIQTWISSFLPIFRLSNNAIELLNEYFKENNGFFEIMVPTLLYNNGFKLEDISHPYSDFTDEKNHNKYYLIQSSNYKINDNDNYGTISYSPKFVGKIEDIPDGILMHPLKWWNTNVNDQDNIELKNTDNKFTLVHYIYYDNPRQIKEYNLDYLATNKSNVKLYYNRTLNSYPSLNHLYKFIDKYTMLFWIWKYDIESQFVSINQYDKIFDIDDLNYNKIKGDVCTISSFVKIPDNFVTDDNNTFGLHNITSKDNMNCEWLYEDYKEYVNDKYGVNNKFIIEDYILEDKKLFIDDTCIILSRKHFHNLCDYIFGFFYYINYKYNLELDSYNYEKFIEEKCNGNTKILSIIFGWMTSIYITSTYKKIYYKN